MDWFNAFVRLHTGRFHRNDWPATAEDTRVFFGDWRQDFERARVTQAEAEAASAAMRENPPQYRDKHLPMLMGKIREARRNAASAGVGGHYDDITLARQACRSCPTCGGEGLTTVPDASRPRGVAAYCTCGAGACLKRLHLQSEPKLANRIRQAPAAPAPADDWDAIEAHWEQQRPAWRDRWIEDAAAHRPELARARLRMPNAGPRLIEAAAKQACYTAEVLGVDPFPAREAANA